MTIVHVDDGSRVDTTHIDQLAAAIGHCLHHLANATRHLMAALPQTMVKTATIAPLEQTRILLFGPGSITHLSERLHDLHRAVTWAKSAYEESEARIAHELSAPSLLTLFIPGGIATFVGNELGWYLVGDRRIAPGIATQRRVARIGSLALPITALGNWAASGTHDGSLHLPSQYFSVSLSTIMGMRHLNGAVAVTPAGARRFDLLPAPDPQSDVLSAATGRPILAPPAAIASTIACVVPYLCPAPPTAYQATASGMSNYVGTLARLNRLSQQRQEMMIQIDHIYRADDSQVWVVHIPGTSAGGQLGSANPSNHDANPELLAGEKTDVQRAVKAAISQAGIPAGAQVVLTGHSQGGLAAMNLAGDADFTARFHLTNVLTCGSPVAGLPVAEEIHTLHLENLADHIPALDGAANEASANHVTVQFTNSEMGLLPEPDPHGMSGYQQAVAEMANSNDPRVRLPLQNFAAAIGFVGGARVTSKMFAATRTKPVQRNYRRASATPPRVHQDR